MLLKGLPVQAAARQPGGGDVGIQRRGTGLTRISARTVANPVLVHITSLRHHPKAKASAAGPPFEIWVSEWLGPKLIAKEFEVKACVWRGLWGSKFGVKVGCWDVFLCSEGPK